MNKKFLSVILFSALMVGTAGTFTSCKDYDDDISNLQGQIDANKSAITELQSQINSGEWVAGVTSTADGIIVKLGNGKEYSITNGKDGANGSNGADGQNGISPKITVADGYIKVSYDNGTTYTNLIALSELKGEQGGQGEKGEDGITPTFSVGSDGHLYVQYGDDTTTKKDLGISISGIYYVEDGVTVKIYMPKKTGDTIAYDTLVLPRTAAITSVEAVGAQSWFSWDDNSSKTITLSYGKNEQGKAIEFNGKSYAKDALLSSAKSIVIAQVNPTMADASLYNFYLTDSKGNSNYVISSVEANQSVDPITRADATPNKGLYNMTVGFKEGVSYDDISNSNSGIAYAIATKDAYGNEILSKYDVKVSTSRGTTNLYTNTAQVEIGKAEALDQYILGNNIIDYYFTIEKDQTANKEATGAELNGNTISGKKAGYLYVTVHYLTSTGEHKSDKTIRVGFVPAGTEADLADVIWTMTAAANKKTVSVDATALADYLTVGASRSFSIKYATDSDADKYGVIEGITGPNFSSEIDEFGYTKWKASFIFDETLVAPTTYIGTIHFNGNGSTRPEKDVTVKIVVNAATTFDFKPLDAYFNTAKTEATAYGTANGTNITYDLFELFNIGNADKVNVRFAEKVPAAYTEGGVQYTANPWLSNASVSAITVDKAGVNTTNHTFGGAYYAREITASYIPFGNSKVEPIKFAFNLTIKSEIFEGELKYTGKTKEVNGGTNATLKLSEISSKDVFGKTYNVLTDTRVNKHIVKLADANAQEYLSLDKTEFSSTTDIITISKKSSSTAIVTPPTCKVQLIVVDEWGKSLSSTDILVTVTK